jgi:hypothetical protein
MNYDTQQPIHAAFDAAVQAERSDKIKAADFEPWITEDLQITVHNLDDLEWGGFKRAPLGEWLCAQGQHFIHLDSVEDLIGCLEAAVIKLKDHVAKGDAYLASLPG